MNIQDILTPERTYCKIDASSRKRALEEVALTLAEVIEDLSAEELFTRLVAREKMGSTALGHGIAIPHCRMTGCANILGGLFTLSTPVDFGAADQSDVDVMFVLIVPEEEVENHLKVLAMLAKRFESSHYRQALSTANDADSLYKIAVADAEPDIKQAHS